MKEVTTVTLEGQDIESAIEEYLLNKGYQSKKIIFKGQGSIFAGGDLTLSNAVIEVEKIQKPIQYGPVYEIEGTAEPAKIENILRKNGLESN